MDICMYMKVASYESETNFQNFNLQIAAVESRI